MVFSQIKITFNVDVELNGGISLIATAPSIIGGEETSEFGYDEVWKTIRAGSMQVTLGTPTDLPGERSAINFVTAFNLDYNNVGQFIVTRNLNEVNIKSNIHRLEFISSEAIDSLGNPINVEFDITAPSGTLFEITNVIFSESTTDKCSQVLVSVSTNQLATEILTPVTDASNTDNPFVFSFLRNQNLAITCKNTSGAIAQLLGIQTPSFFDISARETIALSTPTGINLTVYLNSASDLDIEYSLDDIAWQTSNSFSSLADGIYTVYVRDQYGCKQNFEVNLSAEETRTPYFKLPKSNSIRYANRIEWGDASNYKTDENTLSCESFAKDQSLAYKEIQLYQSADKIPTQFHSNYANHTAVVIKSYLTEVPISIIQKSNNMGLKDKRDAKIFSYASGKSGVYFVSGNLYNYDTDVVSGTHNLNGNLPVWGIVGNYIKVGASFYLIEETIYDDLKGADVLIFSNPYSGTENATIVVGCAYDLFNYETYEYEIDMVDYLNEQIQVRLVATDDDFQTITHLSELVDIRVRQEKTVDIHYWNDTNTDMFYSTGIKHRIRVPITDIPMSDEDGSDIHKTDTNTVLLSSEIYEGEEFIFEPQTKEMCRKTKLALSHKLLTIDGVAYRKNGSFDIEKLEDTNLYTLKVKMIKAGNVFSNNNVGGFEFDITSEEIPGLIETESGFVKY